MLQMVGHKQARFNCDVPVSMLGGCSTWEGGGGL